jgi:hypothetical protein
MLVGGMVFLLREARAGTWLRIRFDYWHLVRLRRYSPGMAGASQLYSAMERLFVVRNMPRPVQQLLRLVHVEQIDISKIKRDDWEVVEYLKSSDPELFKSLKKAAKAKPKKGH